MPHNTKTPITFRRTPAGPDGAWAPTRVEVNGSLDVASVVGFRAMLAELAGEPAINLDLSACPFIDAAGIGALVGAARRLHDAGTRVLILGARPSVRAALHATSVDTVLDISDDRQPAYAA